MRNGALQLNGLALALVLAGAGLTGPAQAQSETEMPPAAVRSERVCAGGTVAPVPQPPGERRVTDEEMERAREATEKGPMPTGTFGDTLPPPEPLGESVSSVPCPPTPMNR